MNDAKYIGLDVHQATISAAVLDSTGKLQMESTFETKAATVLQWKTEWGCVGQITKRTTTGFDHRARRNQMPRRVSTPALTIFLASSSTLGYEYASTNVCSGGCEPSFIARASISTALSMVNDVTTVARSTP